MKYSLFIIYFLSTALNAQSILNQYYKVTAGNFNGIRFWNGSSSYSISMGNHSSFKYGPVQDYSIKMSMNNDSDRGWTWGVVNQVPVAALSTQGTFQIKKDFIAFGKVGIGTSAPSAALHVTGTSYDGTPNKAGTQIREGIIELTRNGSDPFIDFQDDINGTDYDARIQLVSNDNLSIYGAHLDINDRDLRDVRSIQLKDWDDNSGGNDNKYRVLARDGAWQFYDGGVVVGNYNNGTWTDLSNGSLIVESLISIGATSVPSGYKLAVDGKAIMEEVQVEISNSWPDYVFEEDYDLMSLQQLESYIEEHGHLPDIPAEEEVNKQGVSLGNTSALLLKKIEELTLHIIEQQKQIDALEKSILNKN